MTVLMLLMMLSADPQVGSRLDIPPTANLVLDSEPLASGSCTEDRDMYRRVMLQESRRRHELEDRPSVPLALSWMGIILAIGILLGRRIRQR